MVPELDSLVVGWPMIALDASLVPELEVGFDSPSTWERPNVAVEETCEGSNVAVEATPLPKPGG